MGFDKFEHKIVSPSEVSEREMKMLEQFKNLSEDKKQQALKMMNDALRSDKDKAL